MSTDEAPGWQTEAKLPVWKHLQLITQANGCFQKHLTLTSRSRDSLLGQAKTGLASLPSWWPFPLITLGPWPVFAHSVLTTTPSGRYYSEPHLTEKTGSKRAVTGFNLQRRRCDLAGSLTHVPGPGQGMWRINSFSRSHMYSLPERPGAV